MDPDRLMVGIKQSMKAVESGKAALVYVADDADPSVTGKIIALCEKHHVPVEHVPTMEELGQMCAISVGASSATVLCI